jgi:transcriptional regulator with XRE-family HTH domain
MRHRRHASAMSALAKSFGAAVRRLRRAAGLSQDAYALACGLHRTYIGRVERGEANLSLESIDRLARPLGLTAGRLVQAAEEPDVVPEGASAAEH